MSWTEAQMQWRYVFHSRITSKVHGVDDGIQELHVSAAKCAVGSVSTRSRKSSQLCRRAIYECSKRSWLPFGEDQINRLRTHQMHQSLFKQTFGVPTLLRPCLLQRPVESSKKKCRKTAARKSSSTHYFLGKRSTHTPVSSSTFCVS